MLENNDQSNIDWMTTEDLVKELDKSNDNNYSIAILKEIVFRHQETISLLLGALRRY